MKPRCDISVVICTFNRAQELESCLERLAAQDTCGRFSYEILVVDNGSTDQTRSIVQQAQHRWQSPIRYCAEAQPGLAFARNRGVKESTGEWILCFDDDLLADANLLAELFSVAKSTGADCVGGKMLVDLPEEVRQQLGPGLLGLLGESDYGEYSREYTGRAIPPDPVVLRRRHVFEAVGDFDTTMIRGGQDSELTRRSVESGFVIWHSPKALAYHTVGPHRLEEGYLRWSSLRHGQSFAYMDFKHKGLRGMAAFSIARVGQALLIHIPVLLFACVTRNRQEILWRRCLLWRLLGYLKAGAFLTAPRIFPQKKFFAGLEFRKETRE